MAMMSQPLRQDRKDWMAADSPALAAARPERRA
jgi:hypothetical protein